MGMIFICVEVEILLLADLGCERVDVFRILQLRAMTTRLISHDLTNGTGSMLSNLLTTMEMRMLMEEYQVMRMVIVIIALRMMKMTRILAMDQTFSREPSQSSISSMKKPIRVHSFVG
jgi:hypothetical protein